jgi:hypothetical protein
MHHNFFLFGLEQRNNWEAFHFSFIHNIKIVVILCSSHQGPFLGPFLSGFSM